MADPAAYRVNADDSITVLGFKHAVRIGRLEVAYDRAFGPRGADGEWAGPEPTTCSDCGAPASFRTRSEPRGEELVLMHYQCGDCGVRDIEPFD